MVSHLLPHCDPVLKVTIVPRGMAGGYMMPLIEDAWYVSRDKFSDTIAMALGGRIAEELVFGQVTTGASSDLQNATQTARDMVMRYGMSDRLGPLSYGKRDELVFLGREIGEQRDYSEAVAQEIDAEVRRIVSEAYEHARQVLMDNIDKLHAVAEALLEHETLDMEQFKAVMEGREIPEAMSGLLLPDVPSKKDKEASKEKGSEDADAA